MLGIVAIAYFLYKAPAEIATSLAIKELTQQSQINKIFRHINILVGIEISLGLLAIIFLLTNQNQLNKANYENNTSENFLGDQNTQENKSETVLSERLAIIEHTLQDNETDVRVKLEKILTGICNELEACQGALYVTRQQEQRRILELAASYAYFFAESKTICYEFGEGLVGQVAKEGRTINISTIPEGYITIVSGLGSSSPNHLIIVPLNYENVVFGVLELASFKEISKPDEVFLNNLASILAKSLAAYSRTTVTAE
jgi:putative methionine-R-sulfoxide reductase with GAF domain